MAIRLKENEVLALKDLRYALFQKFDILDFRLFGSKARGELVDDSDVDIMIEIPDYNPSVVSQIDDIIFKVNLAHDVFISAMIFGKDELENGPMAESPIYKIIQREGVRL